MGFYVRRPDRSLGNVFQQILSSLSSTPNAKVDWIRSLYVNGLGRTPDTSGFAFWKNVAMNSGASCQSILRDFLGGSEFSARLNAGSASQAVQLGYLVVLKRSVSTTDAGYNYWLQLLTKNQINRSQFINYLIDSTETNTVCKSVGFP